MAVRASVNRLDAELIVGRAESIPPWCELVQPVQKVVSCSPAASGRPAGTGPAIEGEPGKGYAPTHTEQVMTDFSDVAGEYEKTSVVQRAAAEALLALVPFRGTEDVLDVGCAEGRMTAVLRGMTRGRVVGADVSEGMIARARQRTTTGMEFCCTTCEGMTFRGEFDLVFCNSSFQWFRDPAQAALRMYQALRGDGRVVMQAPATRNYSPVFLRAMDDVTADAVAGPVFRTFTPPWFFKDTAEEYARLFQSAGFADVRAELRTTDSRHPVEEALAVFSTGAMVGYLDPANYSVPFGSDYEQRFKEIVAQSFARQADPDGLLSLRFTRVFLSARA
jgi:trans-aconitate 2-methyltransferase